MDRELTINDIFRYRENLIKYGKRVSMENPDKLGIYEIQALTATIFKYLDEIDVSMGWPSHDTGLRVPASISSELQERLFLDFIDWYQVIPTLSGQVYDYVLKNYPKEKYPKILCVGDGEKCHLGRKLALKGYNVVSVDPEAEKKFSGLDGMINKPVSGVGKFKVVQGEFFNTSTDMIDWANLIVGAKIPQCAEQLIGLKKPTVFNISTNAEIHNMRFKGKHIESSKQLIKEISKCSGVTMEYSKDYEQPLFICNGRLRDGR